jgi:PhzF family phenazine biosynthesis protein
MMQIPLFHVDAFAYQPFSGNPAAVCPLSSWLDDDRLRKVAAENNLSETAFLVPRDQGYDLRWFTPRCEVSLCGHATLAAGYVVLNLLEPGLETVRFQTRVSWPLSVRREGDFVSMDFPAMSPKTCGNVPNDLLQGLGSQPCEVLEVNDTYLAVYDSQDAIRKIRPDFALLERLHPCAVSVTAPGKAVNFVSRYFAPSYGIPEDPVTGSAHCVLTPYWTVRLGKSKLHAWQLSERGGELWCEMVGDRIILEGRAVLTMKGSLSI